MMNSKQFTRLISIAFILLVTGRVQALPYAASAFTFPDARGGNTYTYGINDNSIVAGSYSVYHATEGYGYTYNSGSFAAFNAPDSSGAYGGTFATALNNNGSVVGHYYSTNLNKSIGFISNNTTYTPIDAAPLNLNRTTDTAASGINDNGLVVGNFTDYATGAQHGFLYNNGNLSLVGAPGAIATTVNGINNSGLIVGSVTDSSNQTHGFILNGSNFSFFDAPNATHTIFRAISNNGLILGSYSDGTDLHDFVLNNGIYESIEMPQLSASTVVLYGINNNGHIAGTAYGGPSGSFGIVLTPVPLPATIWLFGFSVLGLAGMQRRSKVSHHN